MAVLGVGGLAIALGYLAHAAILRSDPRPWKRRAEPLARLALQDRRHRRTLHAAPAGRGPLLQGVQGLMEAGGVRTLGLGQGLEPVGDLAIGLRLAAKACLRLSSVLLPLSAMRLAPR